MKAQIRRTYLWLVLFVLLSLVLACNMPDRGIDREPMPPDSTPQESVSNTPVDDTSQPAPIDEQITPDEAPPQEEPFLEPGMSRAHPYPIEAEVVTPYWDFRVRETARGEVAWQIMQADDPENPPPPPGKEYFLAKIWVRCKNPEPGTHDIDLSNLFITGDRLTGYTDTLWDHPQPEFFYSDIYTAETLEGWIDILIDVSEENLMLVFDRREYIGDEYQPREVRYVTLEGTGSIEIPPELKDITANELGKSSQDPAKIGEMVITADWEITVLEAVRDQAALDIVMQMNERNKPPDEGLAYVAFRVRVRRISNQDVPETISAFDFKTYVPGMGHNGSDQMKDPFVYADESGIFPHLTAILFPGGSAEGWVIKQVPEGHTPMIVEYKYIRPGSSSASWDARYFSLEP